MGYFLLPDQIDRHRRWELYSFSLNDLDNVEGKFICSVSMAKDSHTNIRNLFLRASNMDLRPSVVQESSRILMPD